MFQFLPTQALQMFQFFSLVTENQMDFKGSKMVFEQEDHYGKHLNVLKL